jgi:hypothetical protein
MEGHRGAAPSPYFLTKIHIAAIPSSWCRVIYLVTANGYPLQPTVTKSHCHERGPTVPSRPRLTQSLLLPLERSPRPGGGFCFQKRFPNQSSSGGHAHFMVGVYLVHDGKKTPSSDLSVTEPLRGAHHVPSDPKLTLSFLLEQAPASPSGGRFFPGRHHKQNTYRAAAPAPARARPWTYPPVPFDEGIGTAQCCRLDRVHP